MTVHRCMTPTQLACGICQWKERLCFSLHCKCGLENCFTYCTCHCIQHIIKGILKSLANLLRLRVAQKTICNYCRQLSQEVLSSFSQGGWFKISAPSLVAVITAPYIKMSP